MLHRPLLLLAFVAAFARAEEKRGDAPDAKPRTPEEQRALFHLPPGFEIQLVAAEPQIQKPMNLNFDAAGRLWVSGSEMYPFAAKKDALGQPIGVFDSEWRGMSGNKGGGFSLPAPPEQPTDSIRVLSDFSPDGRARKISVFADKLNIPIGITPLPRAPGAKGDAVIAHSIPNIWRFEDTDGDGRADKREVLYSGFGFRDTHGMSSNYIHWIDGWIYGCHGFANHSEVRDRAGRVTVLDSGNTYRFRPDGSQFEIFTHGQTNPFGLTFDPLGNLYSCDSHSKPAYLLIRGGYYEGIGKKHDGLGFAPAIMQHSHGSSSIAGISYYAADVFPPEYRDNLFIGNPVTRRINRDRLEWHGSTPQCIEMPDFLTCDDPWFRPVQVKLGPDGALYIADFYNPIIGHYEQPLGDPRRDHAHGRIWRIVYRGEKPTAQPAPASPESTPSTASTKSATSTPLLDLTKLTPEQLIEKLGDPNLEVRRLATLVFAARTDIEDAWNIPALTFTPREGKPEGPAITRNPFAQPHIIWLKQNLHIGESPDLSVTALRRYTEPGMAALPRAIAPGYLRNNASEGRVAELFVEAITGKSPNLGGSAQQACVDFMSDHPTEETITHLLKLHTNTPEKDTLLRYASRVALRDNLLALSKGKYALKLDRIAEKPDAAAVLAEVFLAVPTPDAAAFLLAHLRRTKFSAPRSAEYLRHVCAYLAPEKFGELAALAETLKDAPQPQQIALADGLARAVRERGVTLPEALQPWIAQATFAGLTSPDPATLDAAIAAAAGSADPKKAEPLRAIVRKAGEHGPRRAAALEALMNLPDAPKFAAEALADTSSRTLRSKAVELLTTRLAGDALSAPTLLAALASAPNDLALKIAPAMAKQDQTCEIMLNLVAKGRVSAAVLRSAAVADALAARSESLRAKAAELTKNLPPENARLDAVIGERVDFYLKASPDPAKGAQVFATNCAVCHKFKNTGGNLAPNLDGVAARGPHRLAEDILDPSRNVDAAFRQTIIELKDGQILSGLNRRNTGEQITLTDATGKDVTTPASAVKTETESALSLMPPAFEQTIAPEDFAALLGYLLK